MRERLCRHGATAVHALPVIGFMGLTAAVPATHGWLARNLAVRWSDLSSVQVYRVATSAFVQSRAGIVPSIVALFVLVPMCDHRIGTRLTLVVFAVGDWTATVGTFVALRALSALGQATAQHALTMPNSGASAACYSCAGAFVASLPIGRTRQVVAAALATDLAVQAVVSHMLSDVQHPISAVVGVAVALASRYSRSRTCPTARWQ
jgi:hypothetical protein